MGAALDFERGKRFVGSIPDGCWTSYGEVAEAAGNRRAAQAVGQWLMRRGDEVPGVYRVLTSKGEVAPGWRPADAELPPDRARVKARLEGEGVRFDESGRADPTQCWRAGEAQV